MSNILEIEGLPALHRSGTRLLGLDLGTKTIGIATSDTGLTIASALKTLHRTKFSQDAAELIKLVDHHQCFAAVIGFPLNMDGSEGPRAQATRAFIRNMAQKTDLPFVLWDERLSTVAAERVLLEADLSRQKRAKVIDAAAAVFILQGVLDRLAALKP